ncbi:hypothetical protein BKA56DRAFT_275200 [Ilyonectria sp. MPI-CAGE-AT-0026]|nr:hypothetical protein BKA56DRAFT_275200 [Ilyonectria sp. MPI-CAGE-AT-0026]
MPNWSTVGAKRVSKTVTNSPCGAFIALTAEHLEGWSPPARNRHHSPAPVDRLILYFCTQYIHIRRSQNVDDFPCPRPARELDCNVQLPPSTAASSRILQRSGTERAGSVPHRLREAPTRADRPSVHPRGAVLPPPPSSSFLRTPKPKLCRISSARLLRHHALREGRSPTRPEAGIRAATVIKQTSPPRKWTVSRGRRRV